jgi:hypothetical protein
MAALPVRHGACASDYDALSLRIRRCEEGLETGVESIH